MTENQQHWYDLLTTLPTSIKVFINSAIGLNALSLWMGWAQSLLQVFVLLGSVILIWLQVNEAWHKRRKRKAEADIIEQAKISLE